MEEAIMELAVRNLGASDCWRDIVRIKKQFRLDRNGNPIKRGRVCRISVDDRTAWVVVHGRATDDAVIQMDLNIRHALGVRIGEIHNFQLTQLSWIKSLWFPWGASDPGYRLPAQLGLLSFILGTTLGVIGLVLGLVALKH
jgi:hypothetical protein